MTTGRVLGAVAFVGEVDVSFALLFTFGKLLLKTTAFLFVKSRPGVVFCFFSTLATLLAFDLFSNGFGAAGLKRCISAFCSLTGSSLSSSNFKDASDVWNTSSE